jgi:hypothetical protein
MVYYPIPYRQDKGAGMKQTEELVRQRYKDNSMYLFSLGFSQKQIGMIIGLIKYELAARDTLWRKRIEEIIGQEEDVTYEPIKASDSAQDHNRKAIHNNWNITKSDRNNLRAEQRKRLDTLLQERN